MEKYECELYKGIGIEVSLTYKGRERILIRDLVKETIDIISENILKHLKMNNFKIKVVSKKFINLEIYSKLYNVTNKQLKKDGLRTWWRHVIKNERTGHFIWGQFSIYVINYDYIQGCILHEIAHFLDYKGKLNLSYEEIIYMRNEKNQEFRKSNNKCFRDIYNNEKKYYRKNNYYSKNYYEFFAEAFARYLIKKSGIINKSEYKNKYGKTYNKFTETNKYIKKFINEFIPEKLK